MKPMNWDDPRWQGKTGSMLFEQLCFDLLSHVGFRDLKWVGRSPGDKGRDIEGILEINDPIEAKQVQKWFVECKRSRSGIAVEDLSKNLSWCDISKPDVLLVVTNATVTTQAREWIEATAPNKPYQIRFLEGPRLEQLVHEHQHLYHKYFQKPPDYFSKTVLHLLDSDPTSKQYGFKLFESSPHKIEVVHTLMDTLTGDGYARVNAADSLLEIFKNKWQPPTGFAGTLLKQLKYSHEAHDEIFLLKPEFATEYDARVDALKSFLQKLREGGKEDEA